MGAYSFGGELDSRVLHGLGVGRLNSLSPLYEDYQKNQKKCSIWDNFKQYALPLPEIFKMDIMSCNINGNNCFDAIVTDPPYGYRAAARKAKNSAKGGEHHATEITNCDLLVERLF